MVDEVIPIVKSQDASKAGIYDWSQLRLKNNVDVLLAVSPSPEYASTEKFQIEPPSPEEATILSIQLTQKHRTSAQIDALLSFGKCHPDIFEYSKYFN